MTRAATSAAAASGGRVMTTHRCRPSGSRCPAWCSADEAAGLVVSSAGAYRDRPGSRRSTRTAPSSAVRNQACPVPSTVTDAPPARRRTVSGRVQDDHRVLVDRDPRGGLPRRDRRDQAGEGPPLARVHLDGRRDQPESVDDGDLVEVLGVVLVRHRRRAEPPATQQGPLRGDHRAGGEPRVRQTVGHGGADGVGVRQEHPVVGGRQSAADEQAVEIRPPARGGCEPSARRRHRRAPRRPPAPRPGRSARGPGGTSPRRSRSSRSATITTAIRGTARPAAAARCAACATNGP